MERRTYGRAFGVRLLVGLALMATLRLLPPLFSASFVARVVCDVLGFALLFASVVLGVRAEVRRGGGERA